MNRWMTIGLTTGIAAVALTVYAVEPAAKADAATAPATPDKAVTTDATAATMTNAVVKPGMHQNKSRPIHVLDEITVSGKLLKMETTGKNKSGEEFKRVRYRLVLTDGTEVFIPLVSSGESINLEKYADKEVKLTGKGKERKAGGGKRSIYIQEVTAIEELPPAEEKKDADKKDAAKTETAPEKAPDAAKPVETPAPAK